MRNAIISAIIFLLAVPVFAEKLYVHVTAIEDDGRTTVELTLPLAFVKKAADVLENADFSGHCEIRIDDYDFDVEDMRRIAQSLRRGEEAVVSVTPHDELRFRRVGDEIEIIAADDWDRVVTRVPAELFLVAFRDDDRIDFAAALELLARRGGGEILASSGDDTAVRVWIDRDKVIRGGVR